MSSSSSSILIILTIVSLAGLKQILCQDDSMDSRASGGQGIMSDGGGGVGGQSRQQLHSQKHFSPHRMMHFGKRPLVQQPPVLPPFQPPTPSTQSTDTDSDNNNNNNNNLEVLPTPQQHKRLTMIDEEQQRLVQQAVNELLPYSVVYEMPRDRMLEASVAAPSPPSPVLSASGLRDKHLMEIVDHLLQFSKQQKACNTNNNNKRQQHESNNNNQQHEYPERMMKLMNGDTDNSYELAASIEKLQQQQQPGEQTQSFDQQQQQQQQQQQTGNPDQQQEAINVVGRSVPRSRGGEPFDLTKAHISSLLFGRRITEPPSSLMSLGGFIKKAEPQRMTFMHFG